MEKREKKMYAKVKPHIEFIISNIAKTGFFLEPTYQVNTYLRF